MSTALSKKQMTEEDIKLNYITPAILKGWKGHINDGDQNHGWSYQYPWKHRGS